MDFEKKFKDVRDAFLNLIADSSRWGIDYEAEYGTESSRPIDCSTYHIRGPLSSLKYLCDKLDIKHREMDEGLDKAIKRAVEEDYQG